MAYISTRICLINQGVSFYQSSRKRTYFLFESNEIKFDWLSYLSDKKLNLFFISQIIRLNRIIQYDIFLISAIEILPSMYRLVDIKTEL